MFISSSSATESNFYVGLSSIPRQQSTSSPFAISSIDKVIAVMNQAHLNIWRMAFPPDDSRFPYSMQLQFIQYYLDHCSYDLIVDYYHFPTMHLLTASEWADSISRGLQILDHFRDYQDRIWIEPQNEQLDSALEVRTQQFVDAVRNAGFTNNIVANVFWRTPIENMASVHDPLNKFWTGQHIYFYSAGTTQNWNLQSAESLMQRGIDAGLKMINTEIGADTDGQAYFTPSMVSMVNSFMTWCADRGIGNNVWTLYGDYDYPIYQSLELNFPVPSPLPPPDTWTLTISSSSGGTVTPSGSQTVNVGNSVNVTAYADSGHYLASWNLDGSILPNTTKLTIPSQSSGSSHTLQANFDSNSNSNHVTISAIPSSGVIISP